MNVPVMTQSTQPKAVFRGTYVFVSDGPEVDARLRTSRGNWLGAHVGDGHFWPKKICSVRFEDQELILCPGDDKLFPAVFFQYAGKSSDDAHRLILRFLSAISWMDQRPAVVEGWTGGSRPFRHGRGRAQTVRDYFRYDYLPQNLPHEARLALAFYREAMGLEHPAYSFLSFYKIINLRFPQGKVAQKNWMAKAIPRLKDEGALKRIHDLNASLTTETVESYLYASCRCAVAHASLTQTTVDPEDPSDQRRMRDDLPLIRALAVELIRTEYGIPTQRDVWDKKEYALEGIRWMLGETEVSKLLDETNPPFSANGMPERVNVRTWGHPQLATFAAMKVYVAGVKDGAIYCELLSCGGTAGLLLVFDFRRNTVVFEPLADIVAQDDDTAKAAAAVIDALTLRWEFLLNGVLEIWSEDDAVCLARGDAYLPVNILINPKGHGAEMAKMREELERRLVIEGREQA
jgi:hypothetical protein